MSFHALETPEPMDPRKERIPAKLVPGLNPMTCLIRLQISALKDMVLLSVKREDGVGVGYYKLNKLGVTIVQPGEKKPLGRYYCSPSVLKGEYRKDGDRFPSSTYCDKIKDNDFKLWKV